jgi:hypothetical protein
VDNTGTKILSVDDFFDELVDGYSSFKDTADTIAAQIPDLSPAGIQEKCDLLRQERDLLRALDQKLLDILSLAGEELSSFPRIDEYRIVFARASRACDNIHDQLVELRAELAVQTKAS